MQKQMMIFDAAIASAKRESLGCRKHDNLVVTTQRPTTTEVESEAMGENSEITMNVSYLPKEIWQNKPQLQRPSVEEGAVVKTFCSKS